MTQIGQIEGVIRLRDEFSSTLDRVALQLSKSGKQFEAMGRQLSDLGGQLSKAVTLPIAAAGFAAVKMASDFESSFAGVRKTVDATEEEFAALAQGMRDLAKEIPVSVNELNKIGESAGQLGIAKESILEFTRVVSDMGASTDLSTEEAANGMARIANITGLASDEFENLASAIVAVGNDGASTEKEILEFSLRIAGAGKIAGLAQADIVSIGSAMASVGVEAEAGGTAIQKVLIGMTRAVATGSEGLETFAATAGMSAQQFSEAWREDAAGAFTAFVEGLGQQGEKAFQTLDDLNLKDQRLVRSFLSLSQAGGLLRDQLELGNRAFRENTALAEEAGKRYATFASQVTILWNRLKDVGIELGNALLPILRDLISALDPWLDDLAELVKWFGELPKGVQLAAVAAAALLAALGPLLVAVGAFVTIMGTAATTIAAIGAPMLAAVAAVTALGAVLTPLVAVTVKNWIAGFQQAMEVTKELRAFLSALASVITRDVKAGLAELVGIVDDASTGLKAFLSDMMKNSSELRRFVGTLKDVVEWLGKVASKLAAVGKAVAIDLGPALLNVGALTPLLKKWVIEAERIAKAQGGAATATERFADGMKDLGDALPKELIDGAIAKEMERLGGLAGAAGELSDEIKELAEQLESLVDESLSPTEAAYKKWQAAQKLVTDAQAKGIPVTAEMTRAVGRLKHAFDDLTSATDGPLYQIGERIVANAKAQKEELEKLLAVGEAMFDVGVDDFVESLSVLVDLPALTESVHQRSATAVRKAWVDAALSIGSALANAFAGGDEQISQLLGAAGTLFEDIRAANAAGAEYEAAKAAGTGTADAMANAALAGAQVGASIFQLGATFGLFKGHRGTGAMGGGLTGDYAQEGAQVGAIVGAIVGTYVPVIGTAVGGAIGGAAGGILGSFITEGAEEALAELQQSGNELAIIGKKIEGGLKGALDKLTQGIVGTVEEIEAQIGAQITSGIFSVKLRDDVITVFINGLRQEFESLEDATTFAVSELLKSASFGEGAGEAVKTALGSGGFETFEEIDQTIALAQAIDALSGPSGAAVLAFREINAQRMRETELAREHGLAIADVVRVSNERIKLLREEVDAQFRGIVGGFDFGKAAIEFADNVRGYNEGLAREMRARELLREDELRRLQNPREGRAGEGPGIEDRDSRDDRIEDMRRIQEELEELTDRLGKIASPALTDVVEGAEEVGDALAEAIGDIPKAIDDARIAQAFQAAGAQQGLALIELMRAIRGEQFGAAQEQQFQAQLFALQLVTSYEAMLRLIEASGGLLTISEEFLASVRDAIAEVTDPNFRLPKKGGGQRKAQREAFDDMLEDLLGGSELERIIADNSERAKEIIENAKKFGTAQEIVDAALAELRKQLEETFDARFLDIATGLANMVGDEAALQVLQKLRYAQDLYQFEREIELLKLKGDLTEDEIAMLDALIAKGKEFLADLDTGSRGRGVAGKGSGREVDGGVFGRGAEEEADAGPFDWNNYWKSRGYPGGNASGPNAPANDDFNSKAQRAQGILAGWEDLGLSTWERDIKRFRSELDEVVAVFGRSPRVLEAAGIALDDLLERTLAPVADFQEGLLFSEFSPLSLQQQFDEAKKLFDELVAGGDPADAARIAQVAQQLLALGQQVFSVGGAGFQDLFFDVNSELVKFQQNAIDNAAAQLNVSVDQLEVMRRTERLQERMTEALERMESRGGNFQGVGGL